MQPHLRRHRVPLLIPLLVDCAIEQPSQEIKGDVHAADTDQIFVSASIYPSSLSAGANNVMSCTVDSQSGWQTRKSLASAEQDGNKYTHRIIGAINVRLKNHVSIGEAK